MILFNSATQYQQVCDIDVTIDSTCGARCQMKDGMFLEGTWRWMTFYYATFVAGMVGWKAS